MGGLGLLYIMQNKLDLAEKYFTMATKNKCNNSEGLYLLGYLYEVQNKPDYAEKYYLMAKPSSRLTL
jgi:uncharacterized protein HemY